MRVYWWQDGLHLLPESDAEGEALELLMNNMKVGWPEQDDLPDRRLTSKGVPVAPVGGVETDN